MFSNTLLSPPAGDRCVCVCGGGGGLGGLHVCLHAALSSVVASPGYCELAKQLLAFMEQESWFLCFRWGNLAVMNDALTKEMHRALHCSPHIGDGDCNPTDSKKMLNPSITQEMMPNLTEKKADKNVEYENLPPHRTSLLKKYVLMTF